MSDIKPVVTAWLADLIVKDRRIAELEAEIKEYEFNAHAQSKVQAADSAKIAKLKDRIAELEALNAVALEAMKLYNPSHSLVAAIMFREVIKQLEGSKPT